MKKVCTALVVLLVFSFILAGCSNSTPTATTAVPTTAAQPTQAAPSSVPTTTVQPTQAAATTVPTKTVQPTQAAPSTVPTTTVQPTQATGPAPTYGGTLKMIITNTPARPYGWTVEGDYNYLWAVNYVWAEPLILYGADGSVKPYLAESWQWAPDQLSITFTLRKGVKFHDGTDFNADAVKFTLNANIEAKNAIALSWKSIEVVDNYTVRLNLKYFENTLWASLADTKCMFTSPTAFTKYGQKWVAEHPIGTGPFKFVGWAQSQYMNYEKNTDYWQKGKPYVDKLQYIVIGDQQTKVASFRAGEAQILSEQTGKIVSDLKKEGYNAYPFGAGASFLTPDGANADSHFADKRVREALEYAIDKKALCDAIGFGTWAVTSQLVSPQHPYYDPTITGREYNPGKAKQLLAEAGYPNGFKTKMTSGARMKDVAMLVQPFLAAVGIEAPFVQLDTVTSLQLRSQGWKDSLIPGSSAMMPNFASSFRSQFPPYSSDFHSIYVPPGLKDLIDKAVVATDANIQKSLNQQMLKLLADEAVVIPVGAPSYTYIWTSKVQGADFQWGADWQAWRPDNVWLSK